MPPGIIPVHTLRPLPHVGKLAHWALLAPMWQWEQGVVFSMWLTEDVVARRADHLTDAERTVMSKCALCGEEAKGRRDGHLLFECTAASVVELRIRV